MQARPCRSRHRTHCQTVMFRWPPVFAERAGTLQSLPSGQVRTNHPACPRCKHKTRFPHAYPPPSPSYPGSLQDPAGLGSVRARSRVFGGGTCGGRRGGRSGVRPRPLQHLPGVRAAVSKLCAQATARPRLTHSHAVPHFPTSQSRENRAKYCALRAASPLTGRRTRCEVR